MAKEQVYLRAEYSDDGTILFIHLGCQSRMGWIPKYEFCIGGWRRLGFPVPRFKLDKSSNGSYSISVPVNITIKEIKSATGRKRAGAGVKRTRRGRG